jgi:hypothetical protein
LKIDLKPASAPSNLPNKAIKQAWLMRCGKWDVGSGNRSRGVRSQEKDSFFTGTGAFCLAPNSNKGITANHSVWHFAKNN